MAFMNSSVRIWVGRALSGLIVIPFAYSAAGKLFPAQIFPEMPQQMARIGLPVELLPTLAALEILCVVTYLIPWTSVLGAVLFTGYMGGTIITHMRVGEAPYMQIVFGIVIWLGLWLREPRLWPLLPWRKCKA